MNGVFVVTQRPFRQWEWSRNLARGIEAKALGGLAAYLRNMPLERAVSRGREIFVSLGPRTNVHRDLVANLAVLHGGATTEQLESRARRTWGWAGVTFAEMTHFREICANVGELVELAISPEVDAVLRAPGQPAVFATAHVGPWLLSNLVASRYGFPLTATAPSSSNPGIDRMIQGMLRALPVDKVTMAEGPDRLSDELSRGHKVSLAVDGWDDDGHSVRLLGERMRLDPTAALLAVRHQCPLIPVYTLRLPGGRFRVVADRVLEGPRGDSATSNARGLTEVFAMHLEKWIRSVPGQWLCFTPRWTDETIWDAMTRATGITQMTDGTMRMTDAELDAALSNTTGRGRDSTGGARGDSTAGGRADGADGRPAQRLSSTG